MLKVEVLGGVGEYGRNCFYIENRGVAILLDCGIMNNDAQQLPDLTPAHAAKLDAVFITHAHIDHTGALHLLDDWQCQAPVIMSEMTAHQLGSNVQNARTFGTGSCGEWLAINEQIRFQWGYTGHLIGSVWFKIEFYGAHIFYSGDYVADTYLLKSTLPAFDELMYDLAIIDSGHIEKRIDNRNVLSRLKAYVDEEAQGPVIIPSSYSGKTADLAVYLFQNAKAEVVVDPSLHAFFEDYLHAPAYLRDAGSQLAIEQFRIACLGNEKCGDAKAVHFIADHEDTRIGDLLEADPKASVVLTGYAKGADYEQLRAAGRLKSYFYKTHPDYDDLLRLTEQIQAEKVIFFHSPITNMNIHPLKRLKEKV